MYSLLDVAYTIVCRAIKIRKTDINYYKLLYVLYRVQQNYMIRYNEYLFTEEFLADNNGIFLQEFDSHFDMLLKDDNMSTDKAFLMSLGVADRGAVLFINDSLRLDLLIDKWVAYYDRQIESGKVPYQELVDMESAWNYTKNLHKEETFSGNIKNSDIYRFSDDLKFLDFGMVGME